MAINNVHFKAAYKAVPSAPETLPEEPKQQQELPPETQQQPTGPTTDEVLAMKQKIEEALAQLDSANEYDQYLAMGDKAELEKSKALLMADLQIIDIYLKTGEWTGATAPTETAGAGQGVIDVSELEAGFYVTDPANPTGAPVKLEVSEDGTLNPENNGGTTALTFVLGDDAKNVKVTSVGKDAVIEVLLADGTTKKYTVVGGADRKDLQIQINGMNLTHEINVDASKFINTKADGNRGGLSIIGTKYDDFILGSAGEDVIMGLGGADTIDGMNSADEVYGYANQGDIDGDGLGDGLADIYGEKAGEVLGTDGGDTLYDMFGVKPGTEDYMNGGGGIDKVVRGKTLGQLPENLPFVEGTPSELAASDPLKIEGWFDDSKGWDYKANDGEIQLTKNDKNGNTIDIDILDGYMASAVKDGNDLVLNVVKSGKKGEEPEYYRIRIKDYFNMEGVKLDISGSFIDMGGSFENELNVEANPVVLTGTGNNGDILIGPKTVFEEHALDVEDLGSSTKSDAELKKQLSEFNKTVYPLWANAEVDNGTIIIHDDDEGFEDYTKDGKFDIPTEFGAVAFVEKGKDAGGDYYKVTVASNVGLESKRTVIKVYTSEPLEFQMNGISNGVYDIGEYKNGFGVKINGGKGKDTVAGYEYGTVIEDKAENGNSVTEINMPGTGENKIEDHPEAPGGATDVQGDIEKQIADAETLEKLKEIQETIDDLAASDDNASVLMADDLQTELNNRCNDLLGEWIGKLDIDAYESMTDESEKKKEKQTIENEIQNIKNMLDFLKDKDPGIYAENQEAFNLEVGKSKDFES